LILGEYTVLFGKTPLKAQNQYISKNLGGHGPFGPLWLHLCFAAQPSAACL